MVKSPRLFTIRKDPVIGTEIKNNITGTRYFQDVALNSRNVSVNASARAIRPDGTYSGMPTEQFNKLLKELQQNLNSWNPVIKSDSRIGKELFVNNP